MPNQVTAVMWRWSRPEGFRMITAMSVDGRGAGMTGAERWLRRRINPASTRATAWWCHSTLRMRLLGQPAQRRGMAVASRDALPCNDGAAARVVTYTVSGTPSKDQ